MFILPRTCSSGIVFQKKLRSLLCLERLFDPFGRKGGGGGGPGGGGGGGGGGGKPVAGKGHGGGGGGGGTVVPIINSALTEISPFSFSLARETQFITCIFLPSWKGEILSLRTMKQKSDGVSVSRPMRWKNVQAHFCTVHFAAASQAST